MSRRSEKSSPTSGAIATEKWKSASSASSGSSTAEVAFASIGLEKSESSSSSAAEKSTASLALYESSASGTVALEGKKSSLVSESSTAFVSPGLKNSKSLSASGSIAEMTAALLPKPASMDEFLTAEESKKSSASVDEPTSSSSPSLGSSTSRAEVGYGQIAPEILVECESAYSAYNKGTRKKAFKLINKAVNLFPGCGLVHRIHAWMSFDFWHIKKDTPQCEIYLSQAIDSATTAAIISRDTIEFALFFATLVSTTAHCSDQYALARQACEFALLVRDPIDIPDCFRTIHSFPSPSADARIYNVKQELRRTIEKFQKLEKENKDMEHIVPEASTSGDTCNGHKRRPRRHTNRQNAPSSSTAADQRKFLMEPKKNADFAAAAVERLRQEDSSCSTSKDDTCIAHKRRPRRHTNSQNAPSSSTAADQRKFLMEPRTNADFAAAAIERLRQENASCSTSKDADKSQKHGSTKP